MYSRSRGDLLPPILTQRPRFIIQALLWVQTTQEHNLSPEDRDEAALWPSCELIPSLLPSPSPPSHTHTPPATVLNSSLAYKPESGSVSGEHITLPLFCLLPGRGELKPLSYLTPATIVQQTSLLMVARPLTFKMFF